MMQESPVGVCITGEARYLALERVQRQLQQFLNELRPRLVHYDVARKGSASCSGFQMQFSPSECRRLKSMTFRGERVPSQPYRTTVSIVARSSCAGRNLSNHACCNIAGAAFEPGSLLQYHTAQSCIDSLFDRDANITHVLRTRPDVLYKSPSTTAATLRHHASRTPGTLCRDKYDAKGRKPTYSDIFVLIGRRDRHWFSTALAQMQRDCANGQAVSRFPENYPRGSCDVVTRLDVNKVGLAGYRP